MNSGRQRAGSDQLYKEEPKARDICGSAGGYRLFENREELCRRLNEDVKANREWAVGYSQVPSGILSWN